MLLPITDPMEYWMPYRLQVEEEKVLLRWFYIEKDFTEPFFEETVQRCKSHPCNSSRYRSLSSLEFLLELANIRGIVSPSAFIFHVSRCGSTLLAQMLAQSGKNIVLSEVPVLDQALGMQKGGSGSEKALPAEIYKALLSMLSGKKSEEKKHVFVKLDSWHIFHYSLLRSIYPQVPVILLYRDPEEVLRSHQKRKGMQMVPGLIEPAVAGFDKNSISAIHQDDYMVKMLEAMYQGLLTVARKDHYCLLLNYREGCNAMLERIVEFLQLDFTEAELRLMKERSLYHSKYPDQTFEKEKICEPMDGLTVLKELYIQMEEERCSDELRKRS